MQTESTVPYEALVELERCARAAHELADQAEQLEDQIGELIITLAGWQDGMPAAPLGVLLERIDADAKAVQDSAG